MKLEIITNEKNNLEFYIEGERHTLTNLLKEKLSQKDEVEFVAYKLDHPLENRARFILKSKNAKKDLLDSIKEIESEIEDFKNSFKKTK